MGSVQVEQKVPDIVTNNGSSCIASHAPSKQEATLTGKTRP